MIFQTNRGAISLQSINDFVPFIVNGPKGQSDLLAYELQLGLEIYQGEKILIPIFNM